MTAWLATAGGLVILTFGADFLVRGAATLARRFGMSELLIGLTLVGFGTSTPELVSSIQAAFAGAPGIAVGNVVGSNIANIFLILGLTAVFAPIAVETKAFRRDAPARALATVAMAAVAFTGDYGRIAGAAFLVGLAGYIALAFRSEMAAPASPEAVRHVEEATALPKAPPSLFKSCLIALAGLVMLIVGAKLLVGGAVSVATTLGVSNTLIGLTIVAVGTSLPELVTSLMAAIRGQSDLALGNVIGSNIYNLLGILGATALIHPVAVPAEILQFDIWVMLAATAALILFAITKSRIERWEGAVLAVAYAAYLGWLAINA